MAHQLEEIWWTKGVKSSKRKQFSWIRGEYRKMEKLVIMVMAGSLDSKAKADKDYMLNKVEQLLPGVLR